MLSLFHYIYILRATSYNAHHMIIIFLAYLSFQQQTLLKGVRIAQWLQGMPRMRKSQVDHR